MLHFCIVIIYVGIACILVAYAVRYVHHIQQHMACSIVCVGLAGSIYLLVIFSGCVKQTDMQCGISFRSMDPNSITIFSRVWTMNLYVVFTVKVSVSLSEAKLRSHS